MGEYVAGGVFGGAAHRRWLRAEAERQFAFFRASLAPGRGLCLLDYDGRPLPEPVQELHTVTRLVHSYALGQAMGVPGAEEIIDRGMDELWTRHRDPLHGGYVWAVEGDRVADGRKLAYGHVFVLLAAASALEAGHPDAARLMEDIREVLDRQFWEDGPGRFADEFNRDWTPFSTYRGMNANMHGVEALMAAHEATDETAFLERAQRITGFFLARAEENDWRVPEHYDANWQVDPAYAGDPVFRPPGTTPGHALEWARLVLQLWDLSGRTGDSGPATARALVGRALADGWDNDRGGLVYTIGHDGRVGRDERFWWPVTEGLGALAALLKLEARDDDTVWYERLWSFAATHLIDEKHGGWFPELGVDNRPAARLFRGKPDIYHSLQATLYAMTPGLSRHMPALRVPE
ncbi:AGE family epimerase/isomerase [Defluviimonas aestuarii]|uniref:AGE family epimerase/isomerase n=1 Tax=Albidovulum aestuarii TaxID=1130726 RepID=UPI00249AAB11|nr:AGE family epimerase/isomerase [Defluviimonas aestuarii]MDI3335053.1 AGE family epimerase/isomerase [Defluviimonas aestuarii]